MMENQELQEQEVNPQKEYIEVQQRIQGGDVELAQQWANGDFKQLREQANSFVPEDPVAIHNDELVTPQVPLEPAGEVVDTEVPDDFDPLAHERKVYAEETQQYEAQIATLKQAALEKERLVEEAKQQEEKLLKELDDTRKAVRDEEDDFFSLETPQTSQAVETLPTDTTANNDNASIQEIRAELEQLKSHQREKESWDGTVKSYDDFWSSSVGKEFAPEGKREVLMKDFNEFYSDLSTNLSEPDALLLMHDIRKNGINDFYTKKLDGAGIKLPSEFEKLYDSMEVSAFAGGQKIDPIKGKFVDSGRGTFSNMEDAHFILNKDTIIMQERQKSYTDMRNKINEKQNSATTVSPNNYAPVTTGMQNVADPGYRTMVIKQAAANGYDGANINSIKDPNAKQQMQEMLANIRKYKK